MAQASESIEIKASPKDCYAVITDYASYPEFLKETKDVEVGKKSGNSAEVTFRIEVIKKVSYKLKMVGTPPKKVSWTLLEGDIMKKNEGSWELEEISKGVTKATYTVDVDLKLFVPGPIAKMLVGSSLPSMLKSFKKRIEESK